MASAKEILLATRPWSFPFTVLISLIAGLVGLLLPGQVSWLLLTIAIIGSVMLHAMVNVLNDYFDYKMNVDRPGAGTVQYRPHPIVHGILSPTGTFLFGTGVGVAGLALALLVTLMGRPLAFWLGLIGFILAFAYTGPPFSLKYRALGELGVYLAWGALIPIGSYYLATGEIRYLPVIVTLPLALFVIAILFANNMRDIEVDRGAGVKTLANTLGYEAGRNFFKSLIFVAYISGFIAAFIDIYLVLPPLLGLATLKDGISIARMFDSGKAPPDADPRVAGVLTKYTVLYLIGLILSIVASSYLT
ncbi:MAG: UbiA family prenyltransferase [Desulfurococcales archaeon]|nr:UbiA family prenyltransferase [Desulfurococcales archaeon]